MEQRLSLVTLGVADLARSCAFYTDLGWDPDNDWRAQGVAFFQCGSIVVALWDRDELAADSGTTAAPPGAVTLAYNVRAPKVVDAVISEAAEAGAVIVRAGAPTDWGGYSAVFHDPDGHAWEIAHNPAWTILPDGSVSIAQPGVDTRP
ncbi:MAG: VOC family protein [Candidatus Cloacimonetes bacterium]|nr:VOC family protein [Candidatus Cloacimonadota bacterium]